MPYQNSIFLNLPVADITTSIKFYSAIGFVQNKTFSSADAAMMSLPPVGATGPQAHEGAVKIVLLTHRFYKTFLPQGVEVANPRHVAQCILCVSRPSKESVDDMCRVAAENGGKKDVRKKNDMEKEVEKGGMYGGEVLDPDGHIIQAMYMPVESYEGSQ